MTYTPSITVTTEAQLRQVLTSLDQNGVGYASALGVASNQPFVISLGANISLTQDLPALLSSQNIVIEGNGHTLDGQGSHRGLFVQGGTVTLDNLNIDNTLAAGGNGGSGLASGGGGAGLGGGVFVGANATVNLSQVNFLDTAAKGGNGGAQSLDTDNGDGGGGGMGGNGGNGGFNDGGGGGGGLGAGAGAGNSGIVPTAASAGAGGGIDYHTVYYLPLLGYFTSDSVSGQFAGGGSAGGGGTGYYSGGGGGGIGGQDAGLITETTDTFASLSDVLNTVFGQNVLTDFLGIFIEGLADVSLADEQSDEETREANYLEKSGRPGSHRLQQ